MSRLTAPPAALTVIAATVQDHPNVEPKRLAELIERDLRRAGWAIGVPTGRATTEAAEGPSAGRSAGRRSLAPPRP